MKPTKKWANEMDALKRWWVMLESISVIFHRLHKEKPENKYSKLQRRHLRKKSKQFSFVEAFAKMIRSYPQINELNIVHERWSKKGKRSLAFHVSHDEQTQKAQKKKCFVCLSTFESKPNECSWTSCIENTNCLSQINIWFECLECLGSEKRRICDAHKVFIFRKVTEICFFIYFDFRN